ncbi:MAG TPA: BBE domain-containing protein, partial [Nocardioidaceae bacterium]|nr:BBE domain-containing protein [Nocardioidaceae bacterium]
LVLGNVFAPIDADDDLLSAELLEHFKGLHALGSGSYAGFVATNVPEDIERLYPAATLARLREVKRAYDPGNVFRANFNISP